MKKDTIKIVVIGFIGGFLMVAGVAILTNQVMKLFLKDRVVVEDTIQEAIILSDINQYRQSRGKDQVYPDKSSCDYAYKRALEATLDFSHKGFNPRHEFGMSYDAVIENLAQDIDYKEVTDAWIKSPGHEKNLLADVKFMCAKKYTSGDTWALIGYK